MPLPRTMIDLARLPLRLRSTRPGRAVRNLIPDIRLLAFDFDGVFTDDRVYILQDGTEAVRCFRGDGIGLQKLTGLGLHNVILSTETNPVVSARAEKLNIPCTQSCTDKMAALETLMQQYGVGTRQVAYIGNDINDLDCLRAVALPIVVHNAHADVVPYARYRTRACGGHGAVREVCDLFVRVLSSDTATRTLAAAVDRNPKPCRYRRG